MGEGGWKGGGGRVRGDSENESGNRRIERRR